jgi:putative colanic acid biosynthesis acetyltransferase WcaF
MGSGISLDIEANRKQEKYAPSIQIRRILWSFTSLLFRWSPRPCFAWRRFLLRLFGARIGREVHIYPTASILMPWNLDVGDFSAVADWCCLYNPGKIEIGSRSTVSHRAHLCSATHDYRDPALPLLRCPVRIGSDAWICTEAFVGPGVTVGDGAIVGARAVAVKSVEPWTIVAGNPARLVKKRLMNPS